MANLGIRWLLRGGIQVLKQTIWKEAQKPIHPKLKLVTATEPVLRNEQFVSNQLRRVLIESRPYHSQVRPRCVWKTLSHRLRKDAVRRLFSPFKNVVRFTGKNGKSYLPYLTFGFVGLALTENTAGLHSSNLISDDTFDDFLRNISRVKTPEVKEEVIYPDSLKGYNIDDNLIGKGCFGAIYPARIAEHRLAETHLNGLAQGPFNERERELSSPKRGAGTADASLTVPADQDFDEWEVINKEENMEDEASDVSSVSSDWSLTGSPSESTSTAADQVIIGLEGAVTNHSQGGLEQLTQGHYNLALKIIFNNRIQSDSAAIEVAFESERVLLNRRLKSGGKSGRYSSHPNIVRVHQAFVDENISQRFTEIKKLFPDALPRTHFGGGRGRNKLMYLVMHRYEMTLKEYLERFSHQTEERAKKVMLCQLLEGAAYLRSINIAHRDIKDDNILVECDSSGTPRLAIADFGCSLFAGESGLRFNVPWFATLPAGNKALMAPEIKAALRSTSLSVEFDYRKSDGWSLGAIAYQICGQSNPFYHGEDSLTYNERCLPSLHGIVSPEFEFVIRGLLRRNPNERLSCRAAADMVHLLLWKPEGWATGPVNLWKFPHLRTDLHQWLYQIAPSECMETETSLVKNELLTTFLSRVQRKGLLSAAKTLILFKWERWVQQYMDNLTAHVNYIAA